MLANQLQMTVLAEIIRTSRLWPAAAPSIPPDHIRSASGENCGVWRWENVGNAPSWVSDWIHVSLFEFDSSEALCLCKITANAKLIDFPILSKKSHVERTVTTETYRDQRCLTPSLERKDGTSAPRWSTTKAAVIIGVGDRYSARPNEITWLPRGYCRSARSQCMCFQCFQYPLS